MAQLSRPYQIALGALVLAALMWFLAFGHHSSSNGGSSASTPPGQSAATSSASGGSANGSSKIYHGAAPGVEGLTKDIAKAHGAVATSETYDRHLEEKSAKATATAHGEGAGGETAAGVSGSAPAATVPAGSNAAETPAASAPVKAPAGSSATKTVVHVHVHAPASTTHARAHAAPARTHASTRTHAPAPAKPHATHVLAASAVPSGQQAVERTVASGKVALLLFWNPSGSNDVAVHGQVGTLKGAHLPVVVYEGNAGDVASFGAITRQVPVYGTPTILIVAAKGQTSALTGLQDAFSIEQAIEEARSSAP